MLASVARSERDPKPGGQIELIPPLFYATAYSEVYPNTYYSHNLARILTISGQFFVPFLRNLHRKSSYVNRLSKPLNL